MYPILKSLILSPSHEENYYVNTSSRNIKLPFPLGKNKQTNKNRRKTLHTGFKLIFFFLLSHHYFLCPSKKKLLGGICFE